MTTRRWDKSKPPLGPFTLNKDCFQAQGLVCWYPLGVSGGNYIADQAGSTHLTGANGGRLSRGLYGETVIELSTNQAYVNTGAAPVSAMPLTLAGWANVSATVSTIISISNVANLECFLVDVIPGPLARAYMEGSTGGSGATTAATFGAWSHFGAVFSSTTSRTAWVNATPGTTDTISILSPSVNRAQVGGLFRSDMSSGGNFLAGSLGEAGIWGRALAQADFSRLYSPATRFELWYPLRSRKWFTAGSGGGFQAAWARNANTIIQGGMRA